MAKILVTGAAGFIGSHTTDLLLASGHRVVGVDNFRTGRRENLAAALSTPGFALHELDVAVPGALSALAAAERPAAIIHLAALVSVQESLSNPAENFSLNVQATHLVAEAARLAGVGRVSHNAFLLRLAVDQYQFTVFPDGRTIVGGTDDIATARSAQAKYIGA